MQKYSDIDILNHEIRTPLAGLLGVLDKLGRESLNPNQKGCLKDVHAASQKLLSAIGNLLKNNQLPTSKKITEKSIPSIKTEDKSEKNLALLIEDNEMVQKANMFILEELGYQVHVAGTGEKALKLYEKHHYDIALVDVGLRDMTGIEVMQAMKKYQRNTKIIVVTAYVSDSVINGCKEAGSHLILNKPLEPENFKMQLAFLEAKK
jgi:CheY-like chemotaxis protein